jgi:hypothetical protein
LGGGFDGGALLRVRFRPREGVVNHAAGVAITTF